MTICVTGACTRCAHCGRGLRDTVSVEIGVGPICRRAYDVDPSPANIEGVRSALAEYEAALVLVAGHHDQAVASRRRAVDQLTRLMSLNRDDFRFFTAACDAIYQLGFVVIAAIMRTHIAAWEVFQPAEDRNMYVESTRRARRTWDVEWILRRDLQATTTRFGRRIHVAVPAPDRATVLRVLQILADHCERQPVTLADGRAWILSDFLAAHDKREHVMEGGPRRPRLWRLRRKASTQVREVIDSTASTRLHAV